MFILEKIRVFETVELYGSFPPDVEYPIFCFFIFFPFLRSELCNVEEYQEMLCGTLLLACQHIYVP